MEIDKEKSSKKYKKSQNKNSIISIMDIEAKDIKEIAKEFINGYNVKYSSIKLCFSEFSKSLGKYKLTSIKDLNFYTFNQQIQYFSELYDDKYCISTVVAFYLYIYQRYNNNLFEDAPHVDGSILQRRRITHNLINGFSFISYNPMEEIPKYDKWILSFSNLEGSNSSKTTVSTLTFDFTKIKVNRYREWVKAFIWYGKYSFASKEQYFLNVVYFLKYISDIKNGIELTIYTKPTKELKIYPSEIMAFRQHIQARYKNMHTVTLYLRAAKVLLSFVNENELDEFEEGVIYNLSDVANGSRSTARAVSNEELQKLASVMRERNKLAIENELYYSIFYIALETEFRGSQINTLTIDCIRETVKPNEYVIVSKTKTSHGENIEQTITEYVKKHIEHVIQLTDEYRRDCNNNNIKENIYIIPDTGRGKLYNLYKLIQLTDFNAYLKKCCDEVGIERYTIQNLRDTHMTKAQEYRIRKGLSDVEERVLTGHSTTRVTNKHYIDNQVQLVEMLEVTYGIIIGDIDLQGKIIKHLNKNIECEERMVSNQCGYCEEKSCDNYTYLDCMMCKSFITTLDRIPYFEECIRHIDNQLEKVDIQHDKEDLVNIKRLLVRYLQGLISLQEEYQSEFN